MTAPNVIPLKMAGDSVTLHVESCGLLGFGKYPEVEFSGKEGGKLVAVRVPQKSADRQLTRIALTYATAVGKTLTISRDPNAVDPSKPFWGISQFNGANGGPSNLATQPEPPAAPVAPVNEPAPDESRAKLGAIFKLQEVCFTHALKLATAAEKAGVPVSLEGVSALTAQAMIEANKQGVR